MVNSVETICFICSGTNEIIRVKPHTNTGEAEIVELLAAKPSLPAMFKPLGAQTFIIPVVNGSDSASAQPK